MSPHPIVRHILLQTVEGAPVSTASIPTIRPGAVDPDTGANSPRDEDFKFRTIESLHESTVKISGLPANKMEIAARAVQEGLEHAGIRLRSFAARDYEDQEPEDGMETGQMVFALTRTDKMDLDVFLGICEKAIAPYPGAAIISSQQGYVIDWSTSNVHNLVYAPDSGPPTPMVETDGCDRSVSGTTTVMSRNDSVDAGVRLVSHV